MSEHEFEKIRNAVIAADKQLVAALEARAEAVQAYVRLRGENPGAYYGWPTNDDVVRGALEGARAFPAESLERVVREVLGACAVLVAPLRVAVHGAAGGFSDDVATRSFGGSAETHHHLHVADVFVEVERSRASYGVVPYETSSDGSVSETLDGLIAGDARIMGEVTIACGYDLVSSTGNLHDVETIYGTPSALAACEETLHRDLRAPSLVDVPSVEAARKIAREDHGAAALVPTSVSHEEEGLKVASARVEDRAGLETRFVLIGRDRPAKTGRDRTILGLGLGEEPGALYRSLQPFADRGINLTRIESRRVRDAGWRYVFVLELDGHVTDRAVVTAMEEVRASCRHLKILGSYPRP